MNVNCDSNKNICEGIITITFLYTQTIKKHDMNKVNLTQFESRIQNLINLLVNRKSQMCFSCFCHSKYHKSVTPTLQYDFFDDVYFFSWTSIFSIYLLPADIWELNQAHTGTWTHCKQTIPLIKIYLIKNMKGNRGN